MSVATEFVPAVYIPERARPAATVHTLHPPSAATAAPLLRLTRRGVLVLAALVTMLAGGLVLLAALSAPGSATTPVAPAAVTVRAGDTLWSIASRVAPDRDPRAEVADLQRLNHLAGAHLEPGQTLHTR